MAIFKHVDSGKRFLFVHIPRTAGRFVEQNLEAQGWEWEKIDEEVELSRRQDSTKVRMYDSVDGVEIAHFHRDYYEKYLNVQDIPHVSIVRNPIDRFISASIWLTRCYGDDIQEQMEDPMLFSSLLYNFPMPESLNWYRPQVDFMSDKTHIWKFEDGVGNKFSSWISGIVGVDIKMDQYLQYRTDPRMREESPDSRLKKTDALIDNLKVFYRKDFSKFYKDNESTKLDSSLQKGEKTKT